MHDEPSRALSSEIFLYFALSTSCICLYFGGAMSKIQTQYFPQPYMAQMEIGVTDFTPPKKTIFPVSLIRCILPIFGPAFSARDPYPASDPESKDCGSRVGYEGTALHLMDKPRDGGAWDARGGRGGCRCRGRDGCRRAGVGNSIDCRRCPSVLIPAPVLAGRVYDDAC